MFFFLLISLILWLASSNAIRLIIIQQDSKWIINKIFFLLLRQPTTVISGLQCVLNLLCSSWLIFWFLSSAFYKIVGIMINIFVRLLSRKIPTNYSTKKYLKRPFKNYFWGQAVNDIFRGFKKFLLRRTFVPN